MLDDIHKDANWNVIGLTDLGGSVVERYDYTPYGQVVVNQDTNYGDRDGDGDVDSTDKGTPGSTCTGTVTGSCRILDLDFDGDYDSADATFFDSLDQGLARHPGRPATNVDQPFAHQGLLYDAELSSYQNRARQYLPTARRFAQRDPLAKTRGARPRAGNRLNTYLYAGARPLTLKDPSGLDFNFRPVPGGFFIDWTPNSSACGFYIKQRIHRIDPWTGEDLIFIVDEDQINDPNCFQPRVCRGWITDSNRPDGHYPYEEPNGSGGITMEGLPGNPGSSPGPTPADPSVPNVPEGEVCVYDSVGNEIECMVWHGGDTANGNPLDGSFHEGPFTPSSGG